MSAEQGEAPGDSIRWGDRGTIPALRAFLDTARSGAQVEPAAVTRQRAEATLVSLILAARTVHLLQALIDIAVGQRAYTNPALANALATACAIESAVLAVVLLRRGAAGLGVLLGDAVFGLAGLAVMSIATTTAPGRTDSLNWMLPYTVAATAAVGVVAAGRFDRPDDTGRKAGIATAASVAVALAAVYYASVELPHRLEADPESQVLANTANYAVFCLAGLALGWSVRRSLLSLAKSHTEAEREQAKLASQAQWRAMTVDLFGPILNLLDQLAKLGDEEVPASLQEQAGRLIDRIDAVSHAVYAPSPPQGGEG